MPLQQHHIDDLQRLYRQRFSRVLSRREASDMAIRLIDLYDVLTSPPAKAPRTPPTLSTKHRAR